MAYTVEKFNTWLDQQNHWRQLLGVTESQFRCFPYHGLGHALTDLLFGLKFFWPTKRNLVVMPWGSPLLMPSVQGFVKEGHTLIRKLPGIAFTELSKDLLVAVLVRDHCFSGEILTTDEDLKYLNEKKIPHIEIQHGWGWSSRSQPPLSFGAQIRVIDAQRAIVVVGSRFRFMNHSANLMDWSGLEWVHEIQNCKRNSVEDQSFVEEWETRISRDQLGIRCYSSKQRLFDRLCLEVQGVHGLYFLEHFLKSTKENSLREPGFETRCETTNLARWEGSFHWEWWGETSLSEEEQRSLIIVSVTGIKNKINFEKFNKIYLDCLSEVRSAI